MTYGQTIGHIVGAETFYWGLSGLTLKGAVWGLLGGAMIGAGLIYQPSRRKEISLALCVMIAASIVGWKLINDPKVIYFSNRLDRPRDESWAGLLFGALALLGYLELRLGHTIARVPLRFALCGALAGGIGFGGGGTLMAIGRTLPVDQRWYPWWKFMEFSFGFCFGAGLGLCLLFSRKYIEPSQETASATERRQVPATYRQMLFSVLMILFAFGAWWACKHMIVSVVPDVFGGALQRSVDVLMGYPSLGVALVFLAIAVRTLCWQTAIVVTYCAAAMDLIEDMHPENGIEVSPALLWTFVILTTLAVSFLVDRCERNDRDCVTRNFLLVIWACMFIAYLKVIIRPEFIAPVEGAVRDAGGLLPYIINVLAGGIVVHAIFTAEALLLTWILLRPPRDSSSLN